MKFREQRQISLPFFNQLLLRQYFFYLAAISDWVKSDELWETTGPR